MALRWLLSSCSRPAPSCAALLPHRACAPMTTMGLHTLCSLRCDPVAGRTRDLALRRGDVSLPRAVRCKAVGRSAASAAGGGEDKNRQLFVQHILVPPDKEALLTDLANLINDGADFGELAEQHSTCPSAKQGGLVGWVTPGRTAAEFEAAAFSAPLGEVVTCVSSFGAHLLRVNEQRPLGVIAQMAPVALKALLDAGDVEMAQHQLVDVREANELAAASLPGFEMFALSEFNRWAPTISTRLDPSKSTLVLCHHGVRSMQAAEFLVSQGFTAVSNITGGIDRYTLEADPSVPRY